MGGLVDVIQYAMNSSKTQKADEEQAEVLRNFVSGINCHPATAREEMLAVKKRFGKETGTVAYHGYQSFAPGEATPEMAHEIGIKLAQRLWGDQYQVVVATHLDKESHLHNHFVVNTVSFRNGIKYHRTAKDYHDMQAISDELCREYRLSVIEDPQYGRSKHYGEWRAEQEQRPTWRGLVRSDVDEAIRQEIVQTRADKDAPVAPPEQTPAISEADRLVDEMLTVPIRKEESAGPNPRSAKTEKSPLSEPTSGKQNRSAGGAADLAAGRPSVRKELREIKAGQQKKADPAQAREPEAAPKAPKPQTTTHKQPKHKKKHKQKAR